MSVIRKQYSSQFKAQVVQELLAGEQTLGQIATKYSIHPNVITKWRKAALTAMPDAFDEQTQKALNALKVQHEKEKELLYAQIGRLTTQLNWPEKKLEVSVSISTRQSWIDWHSVYYSTSSWTSRVRPTS